MSSSKRDPAERAVAVIGVGAIHQAGKAMRRCIGHQLVQVVALAEIAAVGRVGPIGRIIQFRGGQDDVLNAKISGERTRGL